MGTGERERGTVKQMSRYKIGQFRKPKDRIHNEIFGMFAKLAGNTYPYRHKIFDPPGKVYTWKGLRVNILTLKESI
jgi:hypothetical protein